MFTFVLDHAHIDIEVIMSMWGDTGLVEYSLVYEQIHVPCGNGLNTKSVRCARRKCGAMRTHGNVWARM